MSTTHTDSSSANIAQPAKESSAAQATNVAPLFLIGAERSGTTMLRLMLNHHPEIEWLNEFEYAVDFMPDRRRWPDLNAYYHWLGTHRIFLAQKFEIDQSLDFPQLVNSFFRQKQARSGKPIMGATIHRWFERILDIWPDARFIYLVRDGRDVARSTIEMGWAGNFWHGVDRWIEAEREWNRMRAGLDGSRFVEVQYEQLISEPERELTRLCEFIGVPYSPAMLSYPDDTTYAPPDPAFASRWKTKLSASDLALTETKIGDMLAARGYERSPVAPVQVGRWKRSWLGLTNRWGKLTHRVRKYGPWLWLLVAISSRIGPPALYQHAMAKKNALDRARLK